MAVIQDPSESVDFSHLTTLRDNNLLHWLSFRVGNSSCVFDLRHDIHAFDDITENDMLAVQMGRPVLCSDDEELATICLHVVRTRCVMLLEVLTFGPLLAMDNSPGLSCFSVKFSSANFSVPYIVLEPVPLPLMKSPPWIMKFLIYAEVNSWLQSKPRVGAFNDAPRYNVEPYDNTTHVSTYLPSLPQK